MTRSDTDSAPVVAGGVPIRAEEFEAIRGFLYAETGIALGDAKAEMVGSRLAKRLRHHKLRSFSEYLALVRDAGKSGPERQEFINCLTTNKTDFFRERHHFDYLRDTVIPRLRAANRKRVRVRRVLDR